MTETIVKFGNRSYRIAFARWDEVNHVGLIQIYDDQGEPFIVESGGLAANEQRQAVASFALKRARQAS